FTGVALTDDLAMDAVEAYAEDGSVAVLAVLAGNDMIVSTDYRTQIPLVLEAVAEGTISKAMIDQAVSRVLGWKYDLGLLGEPGRPVPRGPGERRRPAPAKRRRGRRGFVPRRPLFPCPIRFSSGTGSPPPSGGTPPPCPRPS